MKSLPILKMVEAWPVACNVFLTFFRPSLSAWLMSVKIPAGLMTDTDDFTSVPVAVVSYSEDSAASCSSQNASCSIFKKAGESFELKAKSACWAHDGDTDYTDNPETPNFVLASVGISQSVLAPTTGVNGTIETKIFNFTASDKGIHSLKKTISEVSVFEFDLTLPDYFGETLTSTKRPAIGRFTPDHFTTTTDSDGSFGTGACTGSGLSYSGQTFTYQTNPQLTLTAFNAAKPAVITQNYQGDFVKLSDTYFIVTESLTDATQLVTNGTTLACLDWQPVAASLTDNNDGTLIFTFGNDNYTYRHEANSQIGPFNNAVDLEFTKIQDSDNIAASTLPHTLQPAG